MRPISLFTTVCAFAAVQVLVPTAVNAASDALAVHPVNAS